MDHGTCQLCALQSHLTHACAGLSPLALKLLRGWTATHVGSPGSPPAPIPLWVQAMLLVLYAALQATPPASMAVPQDPRGAAPASQEGPGGTQEPAATPNNAPQPESAAAVQQVHEGQPLVMWWHGQALVCRAHVAASLLLLPLLHVDC